LWEKSTFQIWQNYPAPVAFLPEPDFCRIWKKCQIPVGALVLNDDCTRQWHIN